MPAQQSSKLQEYSHTTSAKQKARSMRKAQEIRKKGRLRLKQSDKGRNQLLFNSNYMRSRSVRLNTQSKHSYHQSNRHLVGMSPGATQGL